ncbi:MAG: TolC family protein [Candidatus Latescibacteria bacterium]|nr:TolC family protein [Candidatus Latescibacterota bacterium]
MYKFVKKFCVLYVFIFLAVFLNSFILYGENTSKSYRELQQLSTDYEDSIGNGRKTFELSGEASLSEYLVYAALHNPELEAAFNRWKATVENIPQMTSLPDPRLTYSYYLEHVETRVGPQRHAFSITQMFPWFGKRDLMGNSALQEANSQWEMFQALKRKLFFSVKRAYSEFYYLQRSYQITEENMELLRGMESIVRSKYTSGKAPYSAVIKFQVEIGKLEERILSLDEIKEPVIAELNAALNRQPDALLPSPASLPDDTLNVAYMDLVGQLKEYNPELKAIDFQSYKVKNSINLAKKQFYPDITLGLNYIETGPSVMPGTKDNGKDPVIGMFSINLPIWRGKYRAAVREAQSQYNFVTRNRKNRENTLTAELRRALYDYNDAQRKIDLYKNTLLPKAHESINVSLREFEAGKVDYLHVIDSQKTLLELELAYERAASNRAIQYAHIELIAGEGINQTK